MHHATARDRQTDGETDIWCQYRAVLKMGRFASYESLELIRNDAARYILRVRLIFHRASAYSSYMRSMILLPIPSVRQSVTHTLVLC